MKKLFFLLLLIPTLVFAGNATQLCRMGITTLGGAGTVSAAPACSTADATIAHDIAIEGFQGSGYELAAGYFTETGTVDEDYDSTALSTYKPTGACNEAARFNATSDIVLEIDFDAVGDPLALSSDLDIYFSFYVLVKNDASGVAVILHVDKGTTRGVGKVADVQLYQNGATTQIRATASDNTTLRNLPDSSWISCRLHLDSVVADSKLQCDTDGDGAYDDIDDTFTRNTVDPNQASSVFIGAMDITGDEQLDMVMDLISFDRP